MKFFGLLSFLQLCHGMYFKLEAGGEKCLKEEVHKDILVTGNYSKNWKSFKNEYFGAILDI